MSTKAMLFAAGLGTRLKPITNTVPKALVKVNGKELLAYNIENLKKAGITDIIINVHHFSDQVKQYLKANNNFGVNITISDESDLLLDTGGGLKAASDFLINCDKIVIQNVDIISNINYKHFLDYHIANNGLATLAVRSRKSSRYFLFTDNNKLIGWRNVNTNEEIALQDVSEAKELAFSGIHIINPELLKILPKSEVFSIVDVYLNVAKNFNINAYLHDTDYWFDIGTIEKLNRAETFLCNK